MARSSIAFLLLFLSGVVGCGDDTIPAGVRDAGRDTAAPDGDVVADASTDGTQPDGGLPDGGLPDAMLPDAMRPDGMVPGPLDGCAFEETVTLVGVDEAPAPGGAAAVWMDGGFVALYAGAPEGPSNVFGRVIPAVGAFGSALNLTGDSFLSQAPAVSTLGAGFAVTWFDNRTGSFEIQVQAFDDSGVARGAVEQVSDNELRDDEPTLVEVDGGALVFWVEDNPIGFRRDLQVRRLDGAGVPTAVGRALTDDSQQVDRPVAAALGLGAYVVWAEGGGSRRNLVGLRVDASGAALGGPTPLTSDGGVTNVSIAQGAFGGAVVYGQGTEVWFRPLTDEGEAGAARRLSLEGVRAAEPAITAFGDGFLVSYAVDGGSRVRVVTATAAGLQTGAMDGPTVEGATHLSIAVSSDEQTFLLTWDEMDVQAARIRCE